MKGFCETDFFDVFLVAQREDLEKIARFSRGRLTWDDLVSEAFLLVVELGEERGGAINLRSSSEQTLVISCLHSRCLRVPTIQRRSVSLDRIFQADNGEDMPALVERMAGPEYCEPLQLLMALDEPAVDSFAIVGASYSQASAYIILLERLSWSAELLADLLQVSLPVLKRLFLLAGESLRMQPSIFDGHERVSVEFQPFIRRMRKLRLSKTDDERMVCYLV